MSDFFAHGIDWLLPSMDGYILPLTKATAITLSLAFVSLIVGMFFAFIFTILESVPFKPVAWLMSLFNLT
ncbi:MAG: hypothetical protein M3Z47_07230, partial [Gilliamella apis]|nr:hypothetical protein [Gilliamella apis]